MPTDFTSRSICSRTAANFSQKYVSQAASSFCSFLRTDNRGQIFRALSSNRMHRNNDRTELCNNRVDMPENCQTIRRLGVDTTKTAMSFWTTFSMGKRSCGHFGDGSKNELSESKSDGNNLKHSTVVIRVIGPVFRRVRAHRRTHSSLGTNTQGGRHCRLGL
jgi:hypothetical protein